MEPVPMTRPRARSLASFTLGLSILLGGAAAAQTAAAEPAKAVTKPAAPAVADLHFSRENLDPSVSACTDFFRYANGGWIAKNPRPADQAAWGRFSELSEQNQEVLHQILETAAKAKAKQGSNQQKIGDFYASCMDEATIEREGLNPLKKDLAQIDAITDLASLRAEIARLHADGHRGIAFGIGSNPSFRNSEEMILGVREGGLGLPDRDDYLEEGEKAQKLREEYTRHVARILELSGVEAQQAATWVPRIVAFETRLAKASKTRAESRDVQASDHWMTLAELDKLTPHFPWGPYLKAIGAPKVAGANVSAPKFLAAFDQELNDTPVADWKAYLRWQLVDEAAPFLSNAFVEENFRWNGKVLRGTAEDLPRWKRCVRSADGSLGEALGRVYVDQKFPPEAKRQANELIGNLVAVLREDLKAVPWMGEATRGQAQNKLAAFTPKIGYPSSWTDYAPLSIERGPYSANVLAARRFGFHRQISRIGKPIDHGLWRMTPPTVNASYSPSSNEITFPAGILQPPFFDPAIDPAWNYGAIGSVIGHEISHGFDDQGSQFDDKGNLRNWWSPTDLQNFKARAECVNQEFNGFSVDGLPVNGKLVLGEAIGDLGGVKLAYAAYQRSLAGKERETLDGFTPEQRFFLSFAQIWAGSASAEAERLQIKTNPHPLPRFRVNGTVSNLPEFAQAFGCKAGDAMVRPDAERCQVW
jgi:putative endopeptidase